MEADRQLLQYARDQLDGWIYTARDRAYQELFAGDDAAVTAEERQLLDDIDAELVADGGNGLWGVDEYEIVLGHPKNHPLSVVCTRHPEIPVEWSRGGDSLTEPEREQFNDLLWDYSERVRKHLQTEVDEFVVNGGSIEE
ncbi:hypothetical protein E6P09_05605 [Haloferax mediterranei ATCC 33500]|uniref:Uncharacterized protein n=1 Tax=Haloferax mediterranei (strain ATCC 33500 / DSM 1411 / JCM 8866 / NBRC 14739 / NCIMB 2177 / R-4) TaxID=523841 RepID=I3R1X9_HALMT|nr:hypothetical protein [Haloferax mediterranei]AFK18239.1 hypothetical protein HFX_0512 [Haloferax mediterranei ATCC 33500]AHZ22360.1 hypothetical protein BM92_06715 [Haloferax mediterranei ATCC 33500]EMA02490.1 hypothetical protein C439_07905 [Haloferax mediterranei ATCC 33500]MDX5988327.1 hypothetical protein [Haloferax mediterranei ATCC 33500]QCQ74761.1 hypothetical protein E6P09_05605 [Haloferax mediterranei ATCC 33500]